MASWMSPYGSTLNPAFSSAAHRSGCARAMGWKARAEVSRAMATGLVNMIRSLVSVGRALL